MRKILFFHHSAEMYGSDKVLLSLVTGLDRNAFNPVVLLPYDGPLFTAFKESGIQCYVVPMLLAGRTLFTLKGLLTSPVSLWKSVRAINNVMKSEQVDIVHSNTLAVLSGAIWAFFKGIPHVWHVHEIINRPVSVRKGFAWMLRLFATRVICNSYATLQMLLADQPALNRNAIVVWNGLHREPSINYKKVETYREALGLRSDDVLVALVGRINRWKGQSLLVDAAEELERRGVHHMHYVIVGSPPNGQEHFLQALMARLAHSPIRHRVTVQSYTQDIWSVWDACDIGVVPSTEPEPFGMVALEAMVSGKPVVAAQHGGLAEIVVSGKTGLLFEPNQAIALADSIQVLANNRQLRIEMGESGRELATDKFSIHVYVSGVSSVYETISCKCFKD